jgi:hypothetical protein
MDGNLMQYCTRSVHSMMWWEDLGAEKPPVLTTPHHREHVQNNRLEFELLSS